LKIIFSRHAKRRAKLYNIPESVVVDLLSGVHFMPGEHQLIRQIDDSDFPLKVIIAVENDDITVITIYPLKKGREK
jgi:hypothetical protein